MEAAWSLADATSKVKRSMMENTPMLMSLLVGEFELSFGFMLLFSLLKDLPPFAEPVLDHRFVASGGGRIKKGACKLWG